MIIRRSGQKGFTLLETLVAVAILGMIGPVFLISVNSASRVSQVNAEEIQAEALIRSQLETVKHSGYLDCDPTPCYTTITDVPAQYVVSISVQIIDTPTCSDDINCNTLQEVTVAIARPSGSGGNRQVLAVSMYKAKR